jgi:hypothetical protein
MNISFHILLTEVYFVNERIATGDIVSAKFALPRVRKLIDHYVHEMAEDGLKKIDVSPYIAAGGAVGVMYSFEENGQPKEGSVVPRRQP